MKRWLIGSGAALVTPVLVLMLVQIVASESGEVVVLQTGPGAQETRLWVVEVDGRPYLRAGGAASGWLVRLSADPDVNLVRAGQSAAFRAAPDAERRAAVNAAMRAKYGWRDVVVSAMVGGRDGAIPVRLDPR